MTQKVKFKIVVAAYNCLEWLPLSLASIEAQSHSDIDLCLVDDASTEEGLAEFAEATCRRLGWKYVRREVNGGCLAATVDAICHLAPAPDDVIVTVDGDDWLYHSRVLERVAQEYERGEVDITYGQCIVYPRGNLGITSRYPQEVLDAGSFRLVEPRWTHLRTFRAHLWQAIDDADLRTPWGEYYRYATDHAFMNPMLEMATPRIGCIEEVLYVYNHGNSKSESNTSTFMQIAYRTHIRQQPKYSRRG